MTHHVYTVWGGRTPLYVGCTNDLDRRMREHEAAGRPWITQATFMAAVAFDSMTEALEVEANRIYKLRPVYNVMHNPRTWPLAALQGPWLEPSATARKRASLAALAAARLHRLGVPA